MRIAFIGLGNMGLPMARNILAAGYNLTVYNRTPEKTERLLALGAQHAASPFEAVQDADIVITMVSDDIALDAVVMGEHGLLQGMTPNAVHVSMSTISPALATKLTAAHAELDQFYLAAPVMGRPEAARNAQLKILLAGEAPACEFVQPVLQVLGSEIIELGEDAAKANAVKLGLNLMIAAMLESMAEALGLVGRYDVDEAVFMDIVNAFFNSPVYKNYGGIMTEQRFEPPGATVAMGLKDINLAIQAAQAVEMKLPLANTVREDLRDAIKQGRGKMDWTSLVLNHK